ncbi:abortive infection family protein [Metabacillus sp. B2-18]|uniref:abortive infection family protein n=1 Tax=Metabacillus sp. B2-18 TaxID=2897333 RepID=UPI001E41B585|nr:abortive infection family protein [Metabacillus sp. B2-18]UGB33616.1 abortive infection family protein [Metabacillus sp. B2-18]
MVTKINLTEDIIVAVSKLIDDSMSNRRDPSHSDLEFQIKKYGLEQGDPKAQGQTVGKAKRVRYVLNWALEFNIDSGEKLLVALLNLVRGVGGFRKGSSNYVGEEEIINLQQILKNSGYYLDDTGNIGHLILDNITEFEMEEALWNYVRRAKKGQEDAALLTGTSKDLLEAVAAHVLVKLWGTYPQTVNFPTLLGQAFVALGLKTSLEEIDQANPVKKAKIKMETSLYQLGCSINLLRNKTGTGHGRPFVPEIPHEDARLAIEGMAIISEYLLNKMSLHHFL